MESVLFQVEPVVEQIDRARHGTERKKGAHNSEQLIRIGDKGEEGSSKDKQVLDPLAGTQGNEKCGNHSLSVLRG